MQLEWARKLFYTDSGIVHLPNCKYSSMIAAAGQIMALGITQAGSIPETMF